MQQRFPWKAFVLLLTAVILWFALRPSAPNMSLFGWDKLDHMAAFFVLSVFARVAWPRMSVLVIFGALALFGGGIEIAQWLMGMGRDADVKDWIADLIATVAGLGCAFILRLILPGIARPAQPR